MYEGKEKCQGCGKTGSESNRSSKDSLCYTCKEELRLARGSNIVNDKDYVRIFQHVHAFAYLKSNDRTLADLILGLLKAFHNPHVSAPVRVDSLINEFGSNGITVNIPANIVDPLRHFTLTMNGFIRDLKQAYDSMDQLAKEAVESEKDRIFNEGVDKGRNLLFQLNNNEITPDQFLADCKYNSKQHEIRR